MLANAGYTVLELGYNVPQYGTESLFTKNSPYTLDYCIRAAKKLLSHHAVYGDKIAVMGQGGII